MKSIYLFVFVVLLSFTFVPVPFARSEKEMPSGNWLQIMPKYVADYTRVVFRSPTTGTDGLASYKKGTQFIHLTFKQLINEKTLQQKMKVAKNNSLGKIAELNKVDIDSKSKFVFYGNDRKYFFAWNRGLYYFDVNCRNGKDEMDSFMKAFPY